ncbi:MAG: hypothetical protein RMJ35_10580, partial [Phycisphaerales bacterium]|nr:hypothetical protein [Phycisphaerales bacterium]
MFRYSCLTIAAALLLAPVVLAEDRVPLIPRDILFGNPDKAQTRLSPDGRWISFLAPVNGVLNVWVAPVGKLEQARPVTSETRRGIHQHNWTYAPDTLLYLQDQDGDENWQIFALNVVTCEARNLIDNPKVTARLQQLSDRHPNELIVGINDRDPRFHDLWKVNLLDGRKELFALNPGKINDEMVGGFITDEDLKLRFIATAANDGGTAVYTVDDTGGFKEYDRVGFEDAMATDIVGFDASGKVMYLIDSRGRDTAALYELDLATREKKFIADHPRADAGAVFVHPTTRAIQAVSFNHKRSEWKVIDPSVQADFDYLKTVADGDFTVTSRTLDDSKWTVAYILDNGP